MAVKYGNSNIVTLLQLKKKLNQNKRKSNTLLQNLHTMWYKGFPASRRKRVCNVDFEEEYK